MTKNELTAELRRAVVRAVVAGMDPQDALAAVVGVAGWMIGTTPVPETREAHLNRAQAMLPRAVECVSIGRNPLEALQ